MNFLLGSSQSSQMRDERDSAHGAVFMCSAHKFQPSPAERWHYSRLYFIDTCVRRALRISMPFLQLLSQLEFLLGEIARKLLKCCNFQNIISIVFGILNFLEEFILKNILDTSHLVDMTGVEILPFSAGFYPWGVVWQWCWWHRMRKGEGIARGDRKGKICLD